MEVICGLPAFSLTVLQMGDSSKGKLSQSSQLLQLLVAQYVIVAEDHMMLYSLYE
jgi:hypothetical protein